MSGIKSYNSKIKVWLYIGLVMVVFQLVIGAVTRLTEAGLSITKWDVVSGTLPPMSDSEWQSMFDLYKETPQFEKINEGMTLSEFKFIFFWEYLHRLWARIMGFVFIIPFIYFLTKGWLDKDVRKRLSWVVLLAALAAIFGWIMVASGLVNRPWVNAYKLSIHLLLGISVYSALVKVIYFVHNGERKVNMPGIQSILTLFIVFLVLQIFLGGMMSGMKAALVYPTWPKMLGEWIPSVLFDADNWRLDNFVWYDSNTFMFAMVQFFHRMNGYFMLILGMILGYKLVQYGDVRIGVGMVVSLLVQVMIGITILIFSAVEVPVFTGSLHHMMVIVIAGLATWMHSKL
ncbi:MAG: COX15/CtaA family protein [Saprospiraceae bacterium]